jgi:hypothetical protein
VEIKAACVCLDIERDIITMWPVLIERNTNIRRKGSYKNDNEGIVVKVRRIIDDIGIVGIQIQPEVSEIQIQKVPERRKSEKFWGRATAPVIYEVNE